MGSIDKIITEEDVITKIKDDGDFDRIRLNIVRILKQNEDLRNNIISTVKESAALNHASAENMTARQLCDAIHDEISENCMVQISDGLWNIIRYEEKIKTEITETVQSVYDKLLRPEVKSPTFMGENHEEPPGFSQQNHSNHDNSPSEKQGIERESGWPNGSLQEEDGGTSQPLHGKRRREFDDKDEDPDIPPGFG